MLRRPPTDARGSSQQQKLFLAFAVILLPWIQLANGQQQQQPAAHSIVSPHVAHPAAGVDVDVDDGHRGRKQTREDPALVPDDHAHWGATPISAATIETPSSGDRQDSALRKRHLYQHQQEEQQQQQARRAPKNKSSPVKNIYNHDKKQTRSDASAFATTLAPDNSVRAPSPLRHQPSGLTTSQYARSLEDWEVEDFVLLATVDGDLYATDRKTGKQLWGLMVDQPMVETIHYRGNSSELDDDYNPVDHYVWAIEPNQDGSVYVWIPEPDARPRWTGFTMKELVEVLSPFAGNNEHEPAVVYVGDKRTTMVTLDAATGRVIKWFGTGGSHVDQAESCLRPNALYNKDAEECSTTGTITLGRTEYTVGIERRDGKPIATLKYAEWTPNNRDKDLFHQYRVSKDNRYISTQHDGKVYAFDYARADSNSVPARLFSQKFEAPVAHVFDVCRPWDATPDSNPDLILLPQPTMPSPDDRTSNSIFLNRTVTGGWYALSGRAYPLIDAAPVAPASRPDGWERMASWDTMTEAKLSKLVGTHSLGTQRKVQQVPRLPGRPAPADGHEDQENQSAREPVPAEVEEPTTIVDKVKSIPQSAATSVYDFFSNPVLIIFLVGLLVYNRKTFTRAYQLWLNGSSPRDAFSYSPPAATPDGKAVVQGAKASEPNQNQLPKLATVEDNLRESDPGAQHHTIRRDDGVIRPEDENTTDTDSAPKNSNTWSKSHADKDQGDESAGYGPITASPAPEGKKKKAHRGRRGGVKHRKGRPRDNSQSREDEVLNATVEEVISNAKKLGDRPVWEPDVLTVANDMQAVSGPVIRMGNIEVNLDEQLGTGSNGTLVFAGRFDGRDVAVKRMLIQFYDIASQETRLLRESDDHPNVIRYYSQQTQGGFLFIALERCAASLAEIVERPHAFHELANAGKLDLPGVLYQITNGISHLHNLRIVHRDLKPQNILVNMGKNGRPRLLVSDFGLCKKLESEQSSFGATTGRAAGTSGWRAPELLLDDDGRDLNLMEASTHSGSGSVLVQDGTMPNNRRATRAIDIFSLGLVFFYVLTNGSHPFDCGDRYMREVNIRKNNYSLQLLDVLGDFAFEAKDLIKSMLNANPKQRPSATEIMCHPFFWSAKKRLSFLCDVSDHFEKEPRDPPSLALEELESHAPGTTRGDFLRALPREFVDSLGKQRKYTGTRLLDLLRALRNKRNHYEDMSDSLKRQVGPLPDGYLSFWTTRFPQLLLVCWNVVYNVQWEETDRFRDYYEPAGL
ncbi:bifunctional endoribonuclease/protein kinase ire1 [Metarhizium rileyi]|uniref:non-specific serine/threonine protein kinase n=1 Tax=Metarhizium rileyi (strain RCEF 4871) TaxID=1649241 RepID=A0A5C6FYU5_METRR|nr:bifunctional endoribonuclease/protein kinase ire1 [Metarhizium rileyi]